MPTRSIRRLAALAAAALVLAACGTATTTSSPGPQIRFGYQATVWGAPAIVAQNANLWSKSGANVKSITLSSGAQVRDALLGGSLDAGSVGSTPFIVGAAKGQLVAVAVIAYAGKTDSIVVAKNSPIQSISDLKGKKIASQSGSVTQQIFTGVIAPRFGLGKSSYQLVNTTFQDMFAALSTHQVDAFAGTDPYPQLAVYDNVGRILTDYSPYDPTPLYLVYTKSFVDQHPGAVEKSLEAWLRVGQLFKSDPAKALSIVSKQFSAMGTSMPAPVLQRSIADLQITAAFAPDTDAYLTSQAQSLVRQGAISSVPDWSQSIDPSFLKKAEKATGITPA